MKTKLWRLLGLGLLATSAHAQMTPSAATIAPPRTALTLHSPTAASTMPPAHVMIFDCATAANGPSVTALSNRNVDGISVRVAWDAVEPAEGIFNWRRVDRAVAQAMGAGKLFELDLVPARHTPAWVYDAGAKSFSWVWDQSYGPPLCTVVEAPLPWDIVYQAKFKTFVDAVAAHYKDFSYALAMVKLEGVNGATDEAMLPHDLAATPIRNGAGKIVCHSNDDAANWTAAGYNQRLIVTAFQTFAQIFATDFPKVPMALMVTRRGFPYDTGAMPGATENALIAAGATYPTFIVQNNGWTATRPLLPGMRGYQEGIPQGANFPSAVTVALAMHPQFLEIHDTDVAEPANAAALAQAHGQVTP